MRTFGFSRRLEWLAGMASCLIIFSCSATAQINPQEGTLPPSELKKMSLDELMNIEVISVSRRPEKLSESASAIQVITGEEIRRSGASSFPEALRLADNLDVAQRNSHDWAISARGFNTELANKLLVLMDGRTIYSPLFSGVFWNVQDYLLEDIDRIEVISGPGGSLWGANAVNGVINIISKNARDTQGVYSEAGRGTWLKAFGGVRYGGQLASNVYFRIYGKYFDRGDQVLPNGSDATDSWKMGQGGFRIDAEVSPQDNFTLQSDIYGAESFMTTGGKAHSSGGNILGRWTRLFSEDSGMSLQLYYDRTHLSTPVANLFGTGTLTDDLDTYDLDFQHNFRIGERNEVVWGLGYRFTHDAVGNAPNIAFEPSQLDHHLYSGFIQDKIMLTEELFFTLGTKIEHNGYTGLELEPSGRLQWNFTEGQMLWGAVSRAVRTPSRIDRDMVQPNSTNTFFTGGADFKSETVIAYELGHRVQLGTKATASLSAFYNEYDRIRSLSTTPTTIIPLFFANNVEGETYGFEFSANYQALDWWRLHGGYRLLKENIRVKPGQFDFNNALNEVADPQQQFSLRSSFDLPQNVELDAGLRWVDTLHNNNGPTVGTVRSYFELDARLGWRPCKNFEVAIVGQNLLHDRHPEYGFPGPTRVEIQRSVYGKVTFRW